MTSDDGGEILDYVPLPVAVVVVVEPPKTPGHEGDSLYVDETVQALYRGCALPLIQWTQEKGPEWLSWHAFLSLSLLLTMNLAFNQGKRLWAMWKDRTLA